jgi:FlaA1/EpsC-like NDP-sugar epimerase
MRLLSGQTAGSARRALIVGAGDAGEMMVREMMRSTTMDYASVGFVDDDPIKYGSMIHGVPVLGARSDIPRLVTQLGVKDILIAIPSARGKTVREIVQVCKNTRRASRFFRPHGLGRRQGARRRLRQVQVEDLPVASRRSRPQPDPFVPARKACSSPAPAAPSRETGRQPEIRPAEIHLLVAARTASTKST